MKETCLVNLPWSDQQHISMYLWNRWIFGYGTHYSSLENVHWYSWRYLEWILISVLQVKSFSSLKLGFIKHILEENLQRDRNLEKKREFSKEREKSQMKKRIFFRRDFFQRKFSFPREKSLFTYFSLNILEKSYQTWKWKHWMC